MSEKILHVTVGADIRAELARAGETMKAIESGKTPEPYFGVGFADISQLFAVFTPKRWELIGALRESGHPTPPLTIAELSRQLKRDYKNVHQDVEKLIEWLAVEENEQGQVFAPYSEIMVDVRLPERKAA